MKQVQIESACIITALNTLVFAYKTVNNFAEREVRWLLKIGGITPKFGMELGKNLNNLDVPYIIIKLL